MRLRALLVAALLAASAVARAAPPSVTDVLAAPPTPGTRCIVLLVTLGHFPRELADAVEKRLRDELQVDVRRLDDLPLPKAAYYPPRKRWRADRLLEHLDTIATRAPAGTRILGMTDVDISTTKGKVADWGIFGLGEIGRRNCVLSMFRLKRGAKSFDHLAMRVGTTAVHEVGHTLGLPHCPQEGCVMQDAEGSIWATDHGTGKPCRYCREAIDRVVPIIPVR